MMASFQHEETAMSENTNARVSPVVAIAATAVTLFSLVGIGVLTGIIPSSYSKDAEQPPMETATAPAPASAQNATHPPVAKASSHTRVANAEPARAPAACATCGTVTSVHVVEHKGEGSGLGAVAGGVIGGVLGNHVGGGNGRTIATVAGIAGGALAGNEVEKRVKTDRSYQVAVRMDDGAIRHFTYKEQPAFQAGDPVRVVDGRLVN
jgi:outer membrane lipoprotein SlyB